MYEGMRTRKCSCGKVRAYSGVPMGPEMEPLYDSGRKTPRRVIKETYKCRKCRKHARHPRRAKPTVSKPS
jgi:hypothetical protein